MKFTSAEWKELLSSFPQAHLLQTAGWGELKRGFGWRVEHISSGQCHAQVLFRSLPFGFSLGYVPRGPIGQPDAVFWQELNQLGREHHAIFIKLEPDAFEGDNPDPWPLDQNLEVSRPIQPAQTIVLDISGDEAEILNRMKQKTRYNIHLAEKKGILVRESADVAAFYRMMVTTGARDAFGIHNLAYYQKAYDLLASEGQCVLLTAEFEGTDLASVMLFRSGQRCWYFYGASTDIERNRMPVYLLQWEAIRWAKKHGCTEYDLWGIPDFPEEVLEEQFTTRSEGLWGVYRFKRGFGGSIQRTARTVDVVFRPLFYRMIM
ncbi:MAG: hypothetical protein C0391_06110, partial [Anaerolinea sp.]|nr:hypothetical protein [Anaerolinea sp.]